MLGGNGIMTSFSFRTVSVCIILSLWHDVAELKLGQGGRKLSGLCYNNMWHMHYGMWLCDILMVDDIFLGRKMAYFCLDSGILVQLTYRGASQGLIAPKSGNLLPWGQQETLRTEAHKQNNKIIVWGYTCTRQKSLDTHFRSKVNQIMSGKLWT